MAGGSAAVRVRRFPLGPLTDLEPLAVAACAKPGTLALVAADTAAQTLGVAWLDSGATATTGHSVLAVGERIPTTEGRVLAELRGALAAQVSAARGDDAARDAAPIPLGLIGWFGYELRGETLQQIVPDVPDGHRASWIRVDAAIVLDHAQGRAELVALADEPTAVAWAERVREVVARVEAHPLAEPHPPEARTARWRHADAEYSALVQQCLQAIRDGESYQLCLTTAATVDDPDDPVTLYRRLRRSSPAHHGALLTIGGVSLLSASPETFLTVRDGLVTTRPIKGTRRRDADPAVDAALAAELAADEKERAENLMIVDLMRNDLQRVCEVGTVTVTGLHEVETYPHVHQLVSTVTGRISAGLDALDAVAAAFPAGSMTGAPKRRAVELLAAWEGAPRGVYSGAFGMLTLRGDADLAMVIRSIVVVDGVASVGAGGGITAQSVPEREVAEMHLKARALLAALGAE